ncbi:MAG: LysM peptidoglycan-binding domain-containing protein [Dermatophilaceae bacterium]
MSAVAAWEVVPQERAGEPRPPRPELRLVRGSDLDRVCRAPEPVRRAGPEQVRRSVRAGAVRAGTVRAQRARAVRARAMRARRVAVVAVGLAIAVLLAGALVARAGGTGPHRVTVQAGQTLSQIALSELPDLPIGTAVAEIQIANRLNTSHVHAGQELVIPDVG